MKTITLMAALLCLLLAGCGLKVPQFSGRHRDSLRDGKPMDPEEFIDKVPLTVLSGEDWEIIRTEPGDDILIDGMRQLKPIGEEQE